MAMKQQNNTVLCHNLSLSWQTCNMFTLHWIHIDVWKSILVFSYSADFSFAECFKHSFFPNSKKQAHVIDDKVLYYTHHSKCVCRNFLHFSLLYFVMFTENSINYILNMTCALTISCNVRLLTKRMKNFMNR